MTYEKRHLPSYSGTPRPSIEAPEGPTAGVQKRHVLMMLIFFGIFNVYALRLALSVAVIHMRNQYNWSSALKGFTLTSCCCYDLRLHL